MLYIMQLNPKYNANIIGCTKQPKIIEFEWHVGEKLPFGITDHNVHDVVAVQADLEELDWIKFHCPNLPFVHHSHTVATWRGEMAQFIVDAIRQGPPVH